MPITFRRNENVSVPYVVFSQSDSEEHAPPYHEIFASSVPDTDFLRLLGLKTTTPVDEYLRGAIVEAEEIEWPMLI